MPDKKNKDEQLFLFNQGTYYHAYELLGCHMQTQKGKTGAYFRVWAPNAKKVNLVGDFNGWNDTTHRMKKLGTSGVWEVYVDEVKTYDKYKYQITAKDGNLIGRALSQDLAIGNSDNILGKIFKIGATILGNDGKYVGRLSPEGKVINSAEQNIGYVKNNGSYIDLDKKVSGYVLQEVAKNRRN